VSSIVRITSICPLPKMLPDHALGELNEQPLVNLNLSPEWLELRAVIVTALEPQPEAKEGVLRAIRSAGNGEA
jgi:hypothetical protein